MRSDLLATTMCSEPGPDSHDGVAGISDFKAAS
jgi:hypothetical protein